MPRLRGVVLLCLLTGCPYDGRDILDGRRIDSPPGTPDAPRIDSPPGTPDAPMIDAAPLDEVDHLDTPTEETLTSTAAWVIAGTTTIDTMAGTVNPDVPPGVVVIASVPQDGGGPDVMVIQAGSIAASGNIIVIGDKPLILVADTIVTAAIDASANGDVPGPGGFLRGDGPSSGVGAGVDGNNSSGSGDDGDSGGTGGSYGSLGGDGGDGDNIGGSQAGSTYGDPDVLIGGGGGGDGSPCSIHGGGGGGALQLTAKVTLTLGGNIGVGGGGGARGANCSGDGGSGAGGGAGGMIYLQAPDLQGAGNIGACGGGGGGGASDGGGSLGTSGNDAPPTGPGSAGAGNGDGGAGGAGSSSGQGGSGTDKTGTDDNGGGGGGGVGHVYIKTVVAVPGGYVANPAYESVP